MKVLVVYYSRTGNTRKVAQAIASRLKAELEELVDLKKRQGFLGYIGAGIDALTHREVPIGPVQKDPGQFDLVVVGTPIWAANPSAAVRTYLSQYGRRIKRIAFFLTMGGQGETKVFDDMQAICGKQPVEKLAVLQKEVSNGSFVGKANGFAAKLAALFGVT